MARFHITRVRHLLEGTVVEAKTKDEAVEKSKKVLRKGWSHIDSKRRRSYQAEEVGARIAGK